MMKQMMGGLLRKKRYLETERWNSAHDALARLKRKHSERKWQRKMRMMVEMQTS
jgi:hypothetical protein